MCLCAYVHACKRTYIHVCIYVCMHVCKTFGASARDLVLCTYAQKSALNVIGVLVERIWDGVGIMVYRNSDPINIYTGSETERTNKIKSLFIIP